MSEPGAAPPAGADPGTGTGVAARPWRWSFARSGLVIVAVVVAGQVIGNVATSLFARDAAGELGLWSLRGLLFLGFVVCTLAFLALQFAGVLAFLRAMHTGVMLVVLSTVAVALGVLVPQIAGFEDPQERVPEVGDVPAEALLSYLKAPKGEADQWRGPRPDDHPALRTLTPDQIVRAKAYRREFDAFKFAEAYFLWHLFHPYGLGQPENPLPPQVLEKLGQYGQRYGAEERSNREKQMKQAFGGQPKSLAISAFAAEHIEGLHRAFRVCTALHLNRTYKSHWFATLLGLLAAGIACNTFRGPAASWLTARKVGWLTVHVGMLVMLAGGAISKAQTYRGILKLDLEHGPQDTFWGYFDPNKPMQMPFHVKLDRFARKDWPTLEVAFRHDEFASRLPEYTLWPGREIGLDWTAAAGEDKPRPRLRFRVRALYERARIDPPRFWEAATRDEPQGLGPLAELVPATVDADGGGAGPRPALLLPNSPYDHWYDADWSARLKVAYGDDDAAGRALFVPKPAGHLGWLDIGIALHGHVEPLREEIALGQTLQVGEYTLTVAEATADFRLDPSGTSELRDPRPLAQQTPRNPGVWVTIEKRGDETPERRLILQSLDAETNKELQKRYRYPDIALKLRWDTWGGAGPARQVLQWGPTTPARLLSESGERTELASGATLSLGRSSLTLRNLLHHARFEKQLEFLAGHVEGPHFDPDFYATDPIGLELEVTREPGTSEEHTELVRLASSEEGLANFWQPADERFQVRFYENTAGFPFEWRSVLSIWQRDPDGQLVQVEAGSEEEREIRVNDYFHYQGYRFFQTDAKAEEPTYSGIGVVYDPGIPYVLYGMYTIIVGTILAFLVKPAVERRARARRAATEGAA